MLKMDSRVECGRETDDRVNRDEGEGDDPSREGDLDARRTTSEYINERLDFKFLRGPSETNFFSGCDHSR